MCRADTISLDLWQVMKDSGCFGVKLGFESGNQYVVDKIVNKHVDLDYARKAVDDVKRVGMNVHGTFTRGLPGETPEQMQDTKTYGNPEPPKSKAHRSTKATNARRTATSNSKTSRDSFAMAPPAPARSAST
jgi:radical SAM superfamily enzyme YgiQ (UPF0313 family)